MAIMVEWIFNNLEKCHHIWQTQLTKSQISLDKQQIIIIGLRQEDQSLFSGRKLIQQHNLFT